MRRYIGNIFKFLDLERLSIIDMASAALLFQWIDGGGWLEFSFLLGFIVIMALCSAAVKLDDHAVKMDAIAKEIDRYAKPKEETPVE